MISKTGGQESFSEIVRDCTAPKTFIDFGELRVENVLMCSLLRSEQNAVEYCCSM